MSEQGSGVTGYPAEPIAHGGGAAGGGHDVIGAGSRRQTAHEPPGDSFDTELQAGSEPLIGAPRFDAGQPLHAGDNDKQDDGEQSVKDRAADTAQAGQQAAGEVAATAADKAKDVAEEAKTQARNVVGEARDQLREHASSQHRNAVSNLRSLGEELQSMAQRSEQSGPATDLVAQAGSRVHSVASWLDEREPGQLVDELRGFARRKPGAFIAGALVAGVLAGRLTRGVVAVHQDDGDGDSSGDRVGGLND